MPSRAKRASSRMRCGQESWCGPSRCRSTTSPRSISTAATIRKRCAAPSRRSILTACARGRQRGEPDGRLIGVGLAIYCEQAAHGTSVYHGWGIPMVPGHEQATARMTPDGGLELRVGVHSHGQGLETTLAQVAHEILGIDVAKIKVVHGDTAMTPYSTGTWGSRCMVMAGGAVVERLQGNRQARGARSARSCCKPIPASVAVTGRRSRRARQFVSSREIARTWYLRPQNLPSDVDPRRPGSDHRLQAGARYRHV